MKLIRGIDLTPAQREDVLSAFIYRSTGSHRSKSKATRDLPPTHASDADWLADHAFYIRADGRLAYRPARCEPACMANG